VIAPVSGHVMRLIGQFAILALVALSAACGSAVRDGGGSTYLVVDQLEAGPGGSRSGPAPPTFTAVLQSDVLTSVISPSPCTTATPCPTVFADFGQVTLRISPKDVALVPTTNNEVTISRYHVDYVRSDGHNTPGVDVPYSFDGASTGTVPATGQLILVFELVRQAAKRESPLAELIESPQIITALAQITFYGRDITGHDVSTSASMSVDFGNFADR
jgi:hypothetical protein